MDLGSVMVSEIRHMEKDRNYVISHIWDIKQKTMNEQTKSTNKQANSKIQITEQWLPEEKGSGRSKKCVKLVMGSTQQSVQMSYCKIVHLKFI